jgi:hypothetical protein
MYVLGVGQMLASGDDYLHYVDCGMHFLTETGINPTLMPDGIHPWAQGLERQLGCLEPYISDLIANTSKRHAPILALPGKQLDRAPKVLL